jgi:hypothetical protein
MHLFSHLYLILHFLKEALVGLFFLIDGCDASFALKSLIRVLFFLSSLWDKYCWLKELRIVVKYLSVLYFVSCTLQLLKRRTLFLITVNEAVFFFQLLFEVIKHVSSYSVHVVISTASQNFPIKSTINTHTQMIMNTCNISASSDSS